ncbi:MAG: adenosylmethionine decarboxylase [Myxococcota bacterium]
MQISVIVATLEGCPFDILDDQAYIERLLHRASAAGGFEILHCYTHKFSPQGVTGTAVLAESHIALHSWPENGVLFVDVGTCSGQAATRAAFDAICAAIPHARIKRQDVAYHGPGDSRPLQPSALQ